MSIADNSRYYPSIDTDYFPRTASDWFWSSSPNANYSNYAWLVYFGYGHVRNDYKNYDNHVRLVRGGQ